MITAIYEFHNLINIIEIARQLSRKGLTKVLTLLKVEFKLQEWATIAKILFALFKNEKA